MAPPLNEEETVKSLLWIYESCLHIESARCGENSEPAYTESTVPKNYGELCDMLEGDIAQLDNEDELDSWLTPLTLLATALRSGENLTR